MNSLDHLIEKRMQEKDARYRKKKYLQKVLVFVVGSMIFLLIVFFFTIGKIPECIKVSEHHLSKMNQLYNKGLLSEDDVLTIMNGYYEKTCLNPDLKKKLTSK